VISPALLTPEGIKQMAINGVHSVVNFICKMSIRTTFQPNGQYAAIDADNYEGGDPVGWGKTRMEAEADLIDQLYDLGRLKD